MWDQIRKFGLEYCDLPTMIWNVAVFLKVLTLNVYGKKKTEIPFIFYILVVVAALCYLYVYLVCMVWFVFVRSRETGDLVAAMVVLSLGISSEIGSLKLLYMFICIKDIRNLTDEFLEFDSHMVPGSRMYRNLVRYMRDVKKRAIFYWAVLMGNGCVYLIIPLLRPGRHLSEDMLVIYGLEPMYETPNYEIAWFMMTASIAIICYISSNVTAYFIVIIGYAESQMLSLSDEVTHVWEDAEKHFETLNLGLEFQDFDNKKIIKNEHVFKNLKYIIKRHATIKTLINQVEDVCSGPTAVGLTFLLLGLISELLGGLENTFLQLPFAFMQVGTDCFIGQRIMDAGEVFERAVYDCHWENFDPRNRKMVLLMLQISQKTSSISAGGMTKMSFRCLMGAMRVTYSAYTAFRSIM
ncbi:hypothetical protein HF086_015541 [Spodoptera exigua]|uniref:Odorant receptor n=1 Tax=Spodoptera exigua TaxID=7107 RepID=A0A922MFH4_SPOEX|nr:hypothetical protein HF086_015541 [Spodoptera exigua]